MVVSNEFHLVCISIEDTLVVCLTILRENLMKFLRWLITIGCTCLLSHLDTTIRHKGTLQRFVCLQTYDLLQFLCSFTDIARTIGSHTGHHLGLHIQDTTLSTLLLLQFFEHTPKFVCCFCWLLKEGSITIITIIIILDKLTHIDFIKPLGSSKSSPCFFHDCLFVIM